MEDSNNTTITNPLRQYFRRPAVYITLPSGGSSYTPDTVEFNETRELAVYPMTAIDEISSRTPDALFNGTAVHDLIRSCIPAIKNPWKINSIDMDSILIAIKSASNGDSLEIDTKCPSCNESSTYSLSLMGLLAGLSPGDYDKQLELGDLKIKFRPLTYSEMNKASLKQFELSKMFQELDAIENEDEKIEKGKKAVEEITLITMEILSKTIEFIETPDAMVDSNEYILDLLKNCDKNIYTTIRDHNAQLKRGTEIKPMNVKCDECGHEYEQPFSLNPTNFFD